MRAEGAQPTVSARFDDGTLVELVYAPTEQSTAFAVARPNGSTELCGEVAAPNGERLIPYSASNNLLTTGCVLLPSSIGPLTDKSSLLADVRAYLHRYVDLSPAFEEIAAHYVLLTWVYDAFNELPYLRFRGEFGTGKTRALIALGSICYKPFFASGASTVSPIFHVLEAFRGTLVLDEADFRFSDAAADLTKILNNGTLQGMPVLRTMSNAHRELNPRAFRVFGPKLIGMRERFADTALESRFLTEETGTRPLRPDIPITMPPAARAEGEHLRNQLLMWRLTHRNHIEVGPAHVTGRLTPRAQQMALPLLSLVDDQGVRERIADALLSQQAGLQAEVNPASEATVLRAVLAAYEGSANGAAPLASIAALFNEEVAAELGKPVQSRWIGWFLRARLKLATVKSHGVYVLPLEVRPQVQALAARFGVSGKLSRSDATP